MASVVFRPYEPGLAPAVTALWLGAIGDRYPLREAVLRDCLEGNPHARPGDAVVAWAGDRLVGFGYVGMLRAAEPETAGLRGTAWLQAVIVDAGHRRAGIGSRIVAELASVAAREGIDEITCGDGVFYLWPGLPTDLPDARRFVDALGFVAGGQTFDLRGDVSALTADAAAGRLVASEAMRFDPAQAGDREALLSFIAREFGADWWHDLSWFLDRGGEIADVVVLRDRGGAIVGFARLHFPESRPVGPPLFWAARRGPASGGLGPIGVARAVRGRGLGRALLALGLGRLRDHGVHDVVIDATSLLGFYGALGFEPWMAFVHARARVADVVRRASEAARPGGEVEG